MVRTFGALYLNFTQSSQDIRCCCDSSPSQSSAQTQWSQKRQRAINKVNNSCTAGFELKWAWAHVAYGITIYTSILSLHCAETVRRLGAIYCYAVPLHGSILSVWTFSTCPRVLFIWLSILPSLYPSIRSLRQKKDNYSVYWVVVLLVERKKIIFLEEKENNCHFHGLYALIHVFFFRIHNHFLYNVHCSQLQWWLLCEYYIITIHGHWTSFSPIRRASWKPFIERFKLGIFAPSRVH